MKTKFISIIFILLLLVSSCGEDLGSGNNTENPEDVPEEDVIVETSGIEINPDAQTVLSDEWTQNISVLDSANFNLQMNENLIQKYELKPGSILVSNKGDGFLRKIKSIGIASNGKVNIETEFCSLEELFKEGSFRIQTKPDNSSLRSGIEISKATTFSLVANNPFADIRGDYTVGDTFDFSASFNNGLQSLSLSFGLVNKLQLTAGVKLSGSAKKCLYVQRLPRIVTTTAPPIVIVPVISIYLKAEISGKPGPAECVFITGYEAKTTISYDGQWHSSSTKDYFQTFQKPELTLNDKTSAKIKISIEPEIQFKIYGVMAPYFF